jgi:hypothetical protein
MARRDLQDLAAFALSRELANMEVEDRRRARVPKTKTTQKTIRRRPHEDDEIVGQG